MSPELKNAIAWWIRNHSPGKRFYGQGTMRLLVEYLEDVGLGEEANHYMRIQYWMGFMSFTPVLLSMWWMLKELQVDEPFDPLAMSSPVLWPVALFMAIAIGLMGGLFFMRQHLLNSALRQIPEPSRPVPEPDQIPEKEIYRLIADYYRECPEATALPGRRQAQALLERIEGLGVSWVTGDVGSG